MHTIDALRIAAACALAAIAGCSPRPTATSSLAPPPAEAHLEAGDWPSYNRDLGGTRFSPLEQIEANNVAELKQAWVYPLGRNTTTGSLTGGSETTPIVIAGTLFVTAADRVVALQADTGRELWRYVLDRGSPSRRGLAYWPGDRDAAAEVFFTAGRRLIALDAATGHKALSFGGTGEIEMSVVYDGAPTRFENLLIVGSNGPPGGVRAFDVRTGAPVWVFETVPQADEPGRETWGGRSAERASVVGWSFSFTVDVDRALLYVSLAGPPTDDGFGGDRPGDNLYANSVVALDARSGEHRWHFQTVHHDAGITTCGAAGAARRCDRRRDGSRARAARQERLSVRLESRDGGAGVLRRGAAGGCERRAGRALGGNAARPGQAAADRACRIRARRSRYARGHECGARRLLLRTARAQRRVAELRGVHTVSLPRGGQAAALGARFPGLIGGANWAAWRPTLPWALCS